MIPTAGSYPHDITAGPDGNLWFTEYSGNKIGRITTAGAITEFTIPTAASSPVGITAGPDGNLWFTEYSGNKIGQVTQILLSQTAVPTMTEWGMIILVILLGIGAVYYLRRRRLAT